jgi:hypothetical protein
MLKKIICFAFAFNVILTFSQESILQKRISINIQNAGIEEILNVISEKSSVNFSYSSRSIASEKKISLIFNNETIETILKKISQEYDLEYSVVRSQIVLKKVKQRRFSSGLHTISGHIRDKETGETLPGATIFAENTSAGTISNAYGFFSLSLPPGNYNIIFSYVGFERISEQIELTKDFNINPELELSTASLAEITIVIDEQLEDMKKSQSSYISVNPRSLEQFPEFAGESGLVKSLQSFTGIQTHSDGSSFFFVRGGNKDQNLIIVDEAPIYNPAHLFGFYSVVIPDVAKHIGIYKADIPIDKSTRLSSLIDVQTRDGNMKKFSVDGMLNPLMYRLSLEGPIVRDKASFYTAYRHSNFKWLYSSGMPNADLYIMDFNIKLNWKIKDRDRLYFSFYTGKDNYTNSGPNPTTGLIWKNTTSTLRWNHLFSNRLFSNATIYVSDYEYNLLTGGDPWQSGISDISFKYDFSFFPNPDKTIAYGLAVTEHEINPGNLNILSGEYNPYIPRVFAGKATYAALYYSRENKLSEKWSWKAGVKMPVWSSKGPMIVYGFDENYNVNDTIFYSDGEAAKTYVNLDWRLSTQYSISEFSSIKSSLGTYHQYLHLISNSISPLSSFEIWMPSGKNIKPQKALQFTLGYSNLMSYHLEFTTELFYKKMYNQIEYVNHASLLLNPLIEGELRFGESKSYGMEFSLRRTKGRLTGWISYTYSRVFNHFEDLNNSNPYPAFYDRPHDFSIFLSCMIASRLSMSANWTYYTGSAITTPVSFYYFNDNLIPVYRDKNNDRLPDYHRLDWAISWQISKPHRKYQHSLNFGIYNLYNRHNAVSINFNKVETQDGHLVVPANLYGTHEILSTQKYMSGIMPSLSYRFKL